jgi:hemerythrin superfamily protein
MWCSLHIRAEFESEDAVTEQVFNTHYDVVAFLHGQHSEIRRLFEETLDSADAQTRERSFYELRRLLAVHETAEELVIRPMTRRKVAFGEGIADARLEEEKNAKELLVAIENMDIDSAKFVEALSELQAAVLTHAEHEETEEFSKLRDVFDDDDLRRAATMARVAESMAPTRPHPSANLASANMMLGPFASMLDRARDALKSIG